MKRILTLFALFALVLPAGSATAQEPANSDLVFRHTCRALEKLVRAHLLAEIDEMRIVLKLPRDTVRKMETVAVVTARRFVEAENWGDTGHREFLKKFDGPQFKTFRLQGQPVTLQSGEPTDEFDHSELPELLREIGMRGLNEILSEQQMTIWLSRIVQS